MAPPFFNHQVSLLRAKGDGGQAGVRIEQVDTNQLSLF
jgi:hypothetical protein